MSVFDSYRQKIYKNQYAGTLQISRIMGGNPSDPKVAEGFLRKKLGISDDDLVRETVAAYMVERGVDAETAAKEVQDLKYLNGFKRDSQGLYVEGRQLKAGIKEAASVARAVGNLKTKWGLTNKGVLSFVAEHIFVVEDRLYLGVEEPTGIIQSFPKNPITNQSSIRYEEYVDNAKVDFTVVTDWDFEDSEWAALWLTAEQQGLGASRSQGYGRYEVTRWEKIKK